MDIKVLVMAAAVFLVFCICMVRYFIVRERRLTDRIQKMLDGAIEGKFEDNYLDESKISVLENSMWRYLCDNEMAYKNLLAEKEQLQAMVSDISHQTVTSISNITLYAQLLEECLVSADIEDGPEVLSEITAIREQVDKLDFLIESLMKLSRLETGIIHVNVQKQDINPVLAAVQRQLMPEAVRKGVQLRIEHTDETAVFDRKWTIEALANVVDNAIKYTPRGENASVSVEAYSFFVKIDVSDNGIGIPEEEQANIFTRFYRSASVSGEPGLGIGLYITREVMKAQNGYMKLTSKAGGGSTFSLFLPKEEMSQK